MGAEEDWDHFVQRHPFGDLVQTEVWARSKREIGQSCELMVLDGTRGIRGGAMLVMRRFGPGLTVGYSARGPLGDDADAVVRATVEKARARGVTLLMLQAAPGDDAMDQALVREGFETGCPSVAPEATIRLDLAQTEDQLLAGMSEMRRRNVRKALRSELDVREASEPEDVEIFQRLHAATAARQGFSAISLPAMRAQWNALSGPGFVRILLARHAGVPVAGILLTSFAGVVTFKFAGWDASLEGSRNANEALHWTAIRWAKSMGAHSYDLGGFDRASAEILHAGGTLDEGFSKTPAFFKLGFGGKPVLLPRARWRYLGPAGVIARPLLRRALQSGKFQKLAGRLRSG
jgi:lipid II:glycine glycyltransferase (peptidoglycan interpeptide bridge formation enzyme)